MDYKKTYLAGSKNAEKATEELYQSMTKRLNEMKSKVLETCVLFLKNRNNEELQNEIIGRCENLIITCAEYITWSVDTGDVFTDITGENPFWIKNPGYYKILNDAKLKRLHRYFDNFGLMLSIILLYRN